MKIEKLELVLGSNLHFETDKILILGYESHEAMRNAEWKPDSLEWRLQTTITFIYGEVIVVYDKREFCI
jgi:hypothetical protein